MIIVGYQGIGKSTLAKNSYKYIDLESGNFWIDGERHDDWYKAYCKIAAHLSKQGYTVFVSSHYVVREELRQYSVTEEIKCCFPDISLKDEWVKKLEDRYNESKLDKDFKAWQNAYYCYFENIYDLTMDSSFDSIIIDSMDYDLKELIEN
jgi:ABC-type oligopeptide transport system ATPase subunit